MTKKINLYWDYSDMKKKKNFGDILSPKIIGELSDNQINLSHIAVTNLRGLLYFIKKYLQHFKFWRIIKLFSGIYQYKIMAIGSIIHNSNKHTTVWGAGIIKKNCTIKGGRFLAVRGPVTQQKLKELGFIPPNVVGDPALLLRRTYTKNIEPIYEYGIIPHYLDYNLIVEKSNTNHTNCLIIDVLTDNPYNIIDKICLCKQILSSSLHGLIVSHTYGIPAVWCKFSDRIYGDNSKYEDYLLSVNIDIYKPYECLNFEDLKQSEHIFSEYKDVSLPCNEKIDEICDNLLSVAPFNIKNKYTR